MTGMTRVTRVTWVTTMPRVTLVTRLTRMTTVPFKSKLTVHCKSRFSIPARIKNREQTMENRVGDRVLQDRKRKIHPSLISR